MRNTIFTLSEVVDTAVITESVEAMIAELQTYVPGYRLKQALQFETIDESVRLPNSAEAPKPIFVPEFLLPLSQPKFNIPGMPPILSCSPTGPNSRRLL